MGRLNSGAVSAVPRISAVPPKSPPLFESASSRARGCARAATVEKTLIDPEHSNVDPEEEVARNRNTLLSYFNDIASIPTLKKEEEVMLAKEMEAATFDMRSGILSIPFTWREAVQIWR